MCIYYIAHELKNLLKATIQRMQLSILLHESGLKSDQIPKFGASKEIFLDKKNKLDIISW